MLIKHIHIVGAGGVASYLLPVLIKTFRPIKITIQDGDLLEARNLDRQMFNPSQVGEYKAVALAALHKNETTVIEANTDWFTDFTYIEDDTDLLIVVADNHQARNHALIQTDVNAHMDFLTVIGGNEYFDNEAYVYRSSWANTPADPRVRHPEITTDKEGSPVSCQGVAQQASPQLAIANLGCAHKILSLIWAHVVHSGDWTPEMKKEYLPISISQSIHSTETKTAKDHQ